VTQPTTKATTVTSLLSYPLFFHGQNVRVLGTVTAEGDNVWLTSGERKILVTVDRRPGDAPTGPASGLVEAGGTFWDVGRLEPDDLRVATAEFRRLSERTLNKPWPGVGELSVLAVRSLTQATPPPAPSVRAIALDPERYADQHVTVVGRFRGRNLYGDLPNSPGQGRFEFVIQVADAALWVTGLQPRGKGFNLNPGSRIDTGRWLEVSGTVRTARGLSWIEGAQLVLASAPADPPAAAPAERALPLPSPEVVFSAPTQDETDVAPDVMVRIQFSRDMRPDSFKGRVRVGYVGANTTQEGSASLPDVPATTIYNRGNNALEIRFAKGLESFRTVRIDLLDGIAAADGVEMKPWSLTFSVGG
jgi:hypothetical protein